jgi:hypothetical protein
MIEGVYEPTDEPKRHKTPEELEGERKTLEFLDSLPWRPFGVEW